MTEAAREPRVAVVVPSFRVRKQILEVISAIGPEVSRIYIVDDACPEGSGDWVEEACGDSRVTVLRHATNQGVGGATITGYRKATADGADVVVKIDGDGQMDPAQISRLVRPILAGDADFTKGNRFFRLEDLSQMPLVRLFGNAALSFMTKAATGYWDVFDPTNGFTAIHARVATRLPLSKISRSYFFESDLLFRLNTLRAVVQDVPMPASYGDETSSLRILWAMAEFAFKNLRNLSKRIFYNYFLRSFSIASVQLVLGLLLIGFGAAFGLEQWRISSHTGIPATSGTVMLAALPIILGAQLVLAFLSYDMQSTPRIPVHRRL